MDLRNIFHSFFRFDETNDDFFGRKSNNFGDNSNEFESEMNRDFEDIVNTFGQMFDVFNRFQLFDDLNDSNRWQVLDTERKSPRDLMMKSSDEKGLQDMKSNQRVVPENGLNSILNERQRFDSNVFRNGDEIKTFRKTYFYRSVNNNGCFEEKKTIEDEFGNSETTITKRIGDQVFTEVIKNNRNDDNIERKEISNSNKNDLIDYKWKFNELQNQNQSDHRMTGEDKPNANSLLKRIFDSFKF